jgi:hypothetical protein
MTSKIFCIHPGLAGALALALLAVILPSCGSRTDGDTWMVLAGSDTLTVSEIGAAWRALPVATQERFLASENPIGDFLLSFARKMMVEDEIRRLGYLEREDISVWSDSWERLEMSRVLQESLQARALDSITPDDLAFFRDHLGTTVWFTLESRDSTGRFGPEHLAEMPGATGAALTALEPGGSDTLDDGWTITLDSLLMADSAVVAQALADTVQLEDYAVTQIARRRAMERYGEMVRAAWEADPPVFDHSGLEMLAASARGEVELSPEETLLTVAGRSWTAAQLMEAARFEATVRITDVTDPSWIEDFAAALAYRSFCADELLRTSPAAAESVLARSRTHALQLSADSLYADFVLDSVNVSEAQIDSAWSASPPEIPEKRTVECILLPSEDALAAFRRAMIDGAALEEARQYDVLPGYSLGGGRTSRPLEQGEVPFGLGDSLFALGHSDTLEWLGPIPYPPTGGIAMLRLAGVIPAHPATREEAGAILAGSLRATFIEERLTMWLAELEETWGLSINERALNDLPQDLGLWADL